MTTADTANQIAGISLAVAIVAVIIALAAAGFAAWHALTAHWARLGDNEGTLVEWAPAEWVGPDAVVIRSNGPDVAWRVWARLTVGGHPSEQRASRLTSGDALQFEISGQQESWDWHARQEPDNGESFNELSAFSYGGLLTWRNRYGRRFSQPIEGYMRRKVRLDPEPFPSPHNSSLMPGA